MGLQFMDPHKVSESRKVRKPLMEKKRRARINDCLEELKNILLQAKKDGLQDRGLCKLDKADILELTVSYMKKLLESGKKAERWSYRRGFQDCARRLHSFLKNTDNLTKSTVTSYLLNHFSTDNQYANNKTTIDIASQHRCLMTVNEIENKENNIGRGMWRPW